MKNKYLLLVLLFVLSAFRIFAQSAGTVKIQGVIKNLDRPFITIETLPSGKRDTIPVRPDGSFSANFAQWTQLYKVRITLNHSFFYQWFAPGFDLSYAISAAQFIKQDPDYLKKYLQQQLSIKVTGYGSLINQYELRDIKHFDYDQLGEHKNPDPIAKHIQQQSDSLWQVTFPINQWKQFEQALPAFQEFAQIKQNELFLTPLYYRGFMRNTDQRESNQVLVSSSVYARLQDTTILKCEECLMIVNWYISQKLKQEHASDTTFRATYAMMLPVVYQLFPKDIADDRAIDFLSEIVRNYYYEDKPTFQEITTLIDQYYPANRSDIRDKLFARLNETQARKQVAHNAFKIGSQAPQMKLVDSTGKAYTLSSFIGKLVYIDFWASWCGSCRAEMPQAKQLYQKFKDDPTIVFLTIAVHDKEESWRKALKIEKPSGLALWDKWGEANQSYQTSYIPRYIVIGKSGELLDAYAPSPREMESLLLKWLK